MLAVLNAYIILFGVMQEFPVLFRSGRIFRLYPV
jgi:hypothetical protein